MICYACGLNKVYKSNVCKDCFKLGIRICRETELVSQPSQNLKVLLGDKKLFWI